MALQQFTARFNAPGFHESETIHADSLADAEARAKEIAAEPRAGWPYCTPSKIKITVEPAILPIQISRAAE
jgi:hypothetical protein